MPMNVTDPSALCSQTNILCQSRLAAINRTHSSAGGLNSQRLDQRLADQTTACMEGK